MSVLCRLCQIRTVARDGVAIDFNCARKAAEFALAAPFSGIEPFWDVTESVVERRTEVLRLSKEHAISGHVAEVEAGLAFGLLEQGLLVDALITASLSLLIGPTADDFCCSAIDVLFDERLFKWESLAELRNVLSI